MKNNSNEDGNGVGLVRKECKGYEGKNSGSLYNLSLYGKVYDDTAVPVPLVIGFFCACPPGGRIRESLHASIRRKRVRASSEGKENTSSTGSKEGTIYPVHFPWLILCV